MTTSPVVLKDLLAILENISADSLAEPWDNVGLMVGDPGRGIKGVLVALDVSAEILAEAENLGCDVVISHHPLIFKPLPALRTDQVTGHLLALAIKKQIAVVSCHSNLDKVAGGVNEVLATSLGLVDCRVLAADPGEDKKTGFGRIGNLNPPLTSGAFIDKLLAALDLPVIKVAGVVPDLLTTIAVCGGSGSELAEIARECGAQAFITGEVKHSTARWAEEAGFCVIDGGHFATENLVVPVLAAAIAEGCRERDLALSVHATDTQTSPFKYHFRK